MLDLANSQIRDHQRHARERADRDMVRRRRLLLIPTRAR
jgi:hypothetical protein